MNKLTPNDPCFEEGGAFWFWCEVWVDKHGPYTTAADRDAALLVYAASL